MLEVLSRHSNQDLIISSYYTYIPGKKNLGVIYDLIPEVLNFEQSEEIWQHRINYMHQVSSNISISEATQKDLFQNYSFKRSQLNWVIKPGLDAELFRRSEAPKIQDFRTKYCLGDKEFIVFLGSRYQKNGYKNSKRFFEGIRQRHSYPFNVVCIGGEELTEFEIDCCKKANIKLYRLEIENAELPTCLSSAKCLVYPSLYEGFGMPVLESLAVGTPVVAGNKGGVLESGGNLTRKVDVENSAQILTGVQEATEIGWSNHVKKYGPEWASQFSWRNAGKLFVESIIETHKMKMPFNVRRVNEILGIYHNKMKYLE
jgi:mannosyltransferase